MKKIYKAELNGAEIFMVGEENNTISMVFQTLEKAQQYNNGEKIEATAVAVNNEVLSFGKSVGFIKNKIEVK